ncbi:acyloxyacyl hydrolase [Pseudomonas sp. BGr12]|uniref:acyloxyacyl hydrolase n=1 Tax=Pseudomonas sp. BGr12 TaxID=2936269 RepID=UPI002559CD4F|nr:acyloxyacyl hydrolase [Pseudomonas sp. BJa5]MDL2426292.1 acyloxyacyl hydrolase [Pseudomonas sp. BJa5]
MKQSYIVSVSLVVGMASAGSALGASITGAIGATSQGQLTERLGVESEWGNPIWGENLSGYWDLGLTSWEKGEKASQRQSFSFAPVFVYSFGGESVRPYVEAGIGLAAFNGTSVGDRKIGSAVHFEDRIGLGLKFKDDSKLGIRAIHYSNAGIKEPNAGIESFTIFYTLPL